MPDEPTDDAHLNVFDTLLMPLRLPGRVVADIETLAGAVVSLQSESKQYLSSVDDRAGELVEGLGKLQGSIDRIEGRVNKLEEKHMPAFLKAITKLQESIDRIDDRVAELESLEETLTTHMEGLRSDLNQRMLAVEEEVRGMRPPMEQMSRDVAKIDELLPNPSDGPLTRLKDTLSSGS
jgi:archaellum component FlaC